MRVKGNTKMMLVAVLLFVVVFAAACNNSKSSKDTQQQNPVNSTQTEPSASKSSDPGPSGPVTVSFYAAPPTSLEDLKTNWFTKYVEDEFKLKINWTIASGTTDDIRTKQSLLLASGDYPDVFWKGTFETTDILKYSKQGVLVPLNDLIKEYAPNLQNAIENVAGLKNIMIAPDGNIYGIPMYNYCLHCYYAAKLWINTQLLDKFGLQMPTTTEEFEHVLQVFKDNGLIPLTGSNNGWYSNPTQFLMNAFAYYGGNYFSVEDGKVNFSASTPEWKEGLRYINRLYSKGLLDQQFFSQSEDIVKSNIAQGKVGIVTTGGANLVVEGGAANPEFKYWRTVPPLKGPGGAQYAAFFGTQPTSLTFAMTNKSTKEQQIAVMKLINYIWDPDGTGTETLNFGEEGKNWIRPSKGELGLTGDPALYTLINNNFYAAGKTQNDGWDQMGPIYGSKLLREQGTVAVSPFGPQGDQVMLQLETLLNYVGHQPKQVYPGAVWIPVDEVDQYATYATNIDKFVKEWNAAFITGNKSLDKEWDAYVKGLDQLGLQDYKQMAQKNMGTPFETSQFKPDPDQVKFLLSLN